MDKGLFSIRRCDSFWVSEPETKFNTPSLLKELFFFELKKKCIEKAIFYAKKRPFCIGKRVFKGFI